MTTFKNSSLSLPPPPPWVVVVGTGGGLSVRSRLKEPFDSKGMLPHCTVDGGDVGINHDNKIIPD